MLETIVVTTVVSVFVLLLVTGIILACKMKI
jgi:hypothetical protein